ncbi:MAG: hypothetical protein IPK13_02440 [Deltaproteobacteria bacterium]|nr:hypothetical protein [Deltaproteobacteria bacterium]
MAPLLAVLGVGVFALVVNVVRYGFARDWLDPGGYVVAILKPLFLTVPAYLVLRVVLIGRDVVAELSLLSRALADAALSVAGFAPVVWFYLVTSPTPTPVFPLFSLGFGALAFWAPLLVRLGRSISGTKGRLLSYAWLASLLLTETYAMVEWLASGIEGRL